MNVNMIFVSIMCTLPILWVIKLFIYDPYKDNKSYEVFALRDEVSMLALTGKISEHDKDYQLLMLLINCEINIRKRTRDSFSVTRYVNSIIAPQTRGKSRFKSLSNNKTLRPYTEKILVMSFQRLEKYLKKLRRILPFMLVLVFVYDLFVKRTNISSIQSRKNELLTNYNNVQETYRGYLNDVYPQAGI